MPCLYIGFVMIGRFTYGFSGSAVPKLPKGHRPKAFSIPSWC